MELDAPFWALVSLILFFGVIIYMKVPRTVAGSLDRRAETISNELEQAQKLRAEAEALLVEYQRKQKAAEAEAGEIIEQAKREAAAMAGEARKRTEEYVTSRTRLAEQKIAQAEAQAIQEVRALSAEVAISAAEKILASRIKGAGGDSLISKSIGDVKARLN